MSHIALVVRLALRDIRHHLSQALLLIIAIATATATLTMALAMNGITSKPFEQTRVATRAPDVVLYSDNQQHLISVERDKTIIGTTGPYPILTAAIKTKTRNAQAFIEGRSQTIVGVDQPAVLSGTWVRPGGVVIERTFAEALSVTVGDRVTIGGHRFVVAGVAVTAAQAPYPNLCYLTANSCNFIRTFTRNIGVVWATKADALAVSSRANPVTDYELNVKLRNANDANSFASAFFATGSGGPGQSLSIIPSTWEGVGAADALLVNDGQSVLYPGAVLLALLAIASVAVLVGRRLSEYQRRVGLLKAVGARPLVVAAIFLSENVALSIIGAIIGFCVGWPISPLVSNPGAALVGSAGPSHVTATTAVEVLGLAVLVALLATLPPAVRASHTSTVNALDEVARPPRRRRLSIRLSRHLPVPMLFGLRIVARRPRRALLAASNMAITITGLVAAVSFHTSVVGKFSAAARSGLTSGGLSDPVINRDMQMLAVITVMIVVLSLLNALFTTWATVLDAQRASAIMRALGAHFQQVTRGLVIAQMLSALPGAIVGVGLGLLLITTEMKNNGTLPPAPLVLVVVIAALGLVAALTAVPARISVRQSVSKVLTAESP